MESEKEARHEAEQKLLEVEKEKGEMSVDITQLQQQVAALKQEVEAEAVKTKQLLEQEAEKQKQLETTMKSKEKIITKLRASDLQWSMVR